MTDIQRLLVMLLGVLGLVLLAYVARDKRVRGYTVAPASWLLAVVMFYFWTAFVRVPGEQQDLANILSRWVTLYGVVLIVGAAALALWHRDK